MQCRLGQTSPKRRESDAELTERGLHEPDLSQEGECDWREYPADNPKNIDESAPAMPFSIAGSKVVKRLERSGGLLALPTIAKGVVIVPTAKPVISNFRSQ